MAPEQLKVKREARFLGRTQQDRQGSFVRYGASEALEQGCPEFTGVILGSSSRTRMKNDFSFGSGNQKGSSSHQRALNRLFNSFRGVHGTAGGFHAFSQMQSRMDVFSLSRKGRKNMNGRSAHQ